MATVNRREMAATFEKLGNLLVSGIPFLQAVEVVAGECRDKRVAKALRDIHRRHSERQKVGDVLSEYDHTFPKSVQLLWKAGQKKGLDQCCLRIAQILRAELSN